MKRIFCIIAAIAMVGLSVHATSGLAQGAATPDSIAMISVNMPNDDTLLSEYQSSTNAAHEGEVVVTGGSDAGLVSAATQGASTITQPEAMPIPPIAAVEQDAATGQSGIPAHIPAPTPAPEVYYTIKIFDIDNVLWQTLQVIEGEGILIPIELTLEDHTFLYWYEDGYRDTPYALDTPLHKDIVLLPFFEVIPASEEDAGDGGPIAAEGENTDTADGSKDTDAGPQIEIEDDENPVPTVAVVYNFASTNEMGLPLDGSVITVTAVLEGFPEDAVLTFQWQNNAEGEYQDILDAVGQSFSFVASESTTGCLWRVKVAIAMPEEIL